MKEPVWLNIDVLFSVQEELLARFGGLSGLRDRGLLESALHRPQQRFSYEEATYFQLAATYTHGLVKNHPFLDGNKRIGYMAAYIFLGLNGFELDVPEEQVVLHTLALAAGEESVDGYAAWLEEGCAG